MPKVVKADSVGETCLLEEGLKGAVEHVVAAQGRVIANPDHNRCAQESQRIIAPEGETTWRLTRERVFWDLDGGAA